MTRCRPKVHPSSDGEKPSAQPPLHKVDASPSFAIVCVILPFFFFSNARPCPAGVGHSRTPIIRRQRSLRSYPIESHLARRCWPFDTLKNSRYSDSNPERCALNIGLASALSGRMTGACGGGVGVRPCPNFGRLRLAGHLALCLGIRRPATSIHQSNCSIVEVRLHLHSPACKIRLHDKKVELREGRHVEIMHRVS